MATLVLAAVMLGLLAVSLLLWSWLLVVGLRWARAERPMLGRAILTALVASFAELAFAILMQSFVQSAPDWLLPLALARLLVSLLLPLAVIHKMFKTSFLRSLQAWLPTNLATIVILAATYLLIRPYLFEGFQTPTNAMAPTLLGQHWLGVCVECGGPAYCSPDPGDWAEPPTMICRDHFHIAESKSHGPAEHDGDRFLVAKFLKPRRWDVIVFQYPAQPDRLYVMRLVGLPGEEIQIVGGEVRVNGQGLTPPEELREMRFLESPPGWPGEAWGSAARPARLASDEYFVLGDFGAKSSDSRIWQQGAPGHAEYAVPASHLAGVVTHIYWPPERWRTLR